MGRAIEIRYLNQERRGAWEEWHDDRIGAGGPLSGAVAGGAVGFDPRHDGAFELVTVRVRDRDGAEGLGYTYTVGAGGGAMQQLIARDLGPLLEGADETRIEALWQKLWWAVHYVGRGGLAVHAISAIDTALWDLMARRRGLPLWRLLGGHDPQVPAYAGGIDLSIPARPAAAPDRGQPRQGLPRDQDEGRPRAPVRGHGAGRGDARAARPGRAADGRRQHALERRSGDPGGARVRRAWGLLARGADHPGRCPGPRPDPAGRRPADRRRREPPQHLRVPGADRGRRGVLPRARPLELRRGLGLAQGRAPRRGRQPAGDLARRPRPPRPPARRGAERVLPRGPRLRPRALHRRAARGSRTAGRAHPSGRATASSSTGRGWRRCAPTEEPLAGLRAARSRSPPRSRSCRARRGRRRAARRACRRP